MIEKGKAEESINKQNIKSAKYEIGYMLYGFRHNKITEKCVMQQGNYLNTGLGWTKNQINKIKEVHHLRQLQ